MPSLQTIPHRRQRSEDDDESEESSSSSFANPTPAPQPSSSSKRRRLETTQEQTDESSTSGDSILDEGSDNQEEGNDSNATPTSGRDPGPARNLPIIQNGDLVTINQESYKPGAIVRIKVTDFVTYTSAEFYPGPKLNMVIGPNGTGKSTLVCAICLGLGWGPQHLGRAKDPGEFVKHGCREAIIEIELAKGPKHPQNSIICRTIKRDGNKSTFTINGKPTSRAQVLKLAQSFAIQIDNLCQFLPQDKVSEFAALTPIELLSSTQRAASGPEMVELHDNLKQLRAEQKKLQGDNQGDKELLENLENRQEMQRADVERMRQRAQIIKQIKILELYRPVIIYKEIIERHKEIKQEKNTCERELEILKAELEPALSSVTKKQEYCNQLVAATKHKKRAVDNADQAATGIGRKIEELEDSMKSLDSQIDSERKRGTKYRQDTIKIQQNINKLKRQLNEEPVEFDAEWYNERIREKRREMREFEDKANRIKEDRRPLFEALKEKSDKLRNAEQQLKSLNSQTGQQEKKLKDLSHETFRAYEWIRNNQDRFEKEVFGPPAITCSVKDPQYADAIESLLQRTDFIGFTVQSRNDFRTLQRALNDEVQVSDISIRTSTVPLSSFRPPLSDDELRDLGFAGWAKDFLNGPEPVIAILCSENRFHQTPISLRDISDETFSKLENSALSSWVAGKQIYRITRRREYGPSATSTRVGQVRLAKIWTSQPVDESTRMELDQAIQSLQDEKSEAERKINLDRARISQFKEDRDECERERMELEREKSEKQTALTNFRAIPERIRIEKEKQRDIQGFFDGIRARVIEIRSQQDQVSIKKAKVTIEYADAVENLRKLEEEFIKLSLRHIEGTSDLATLKARSAKHRAKLKTKEDELVKKVQEFRDHSENVKKAHAEASKVAKIAKDQPEMDELKRTIAHYTLDQLDADIDSEKARLELTHGGSSSVVQEFEERERQIAQLRKKLSDFETQLSEFSHAINEIRGRWEPKLDSIVESINSAFSDSFARIGCAGQVSLDKPGDQDGPEGQSNGNDFDQWSIQIHVKFRENESLSLLDSHRQSGGERAVSTIFYLMALQSLSASPFRVVDEINQGMDPRNERMVHERLVDLACAPSEDGSGGGQYFLITPKLLNGLVYKPGMRVLCIVSGEHMPTDHNLIDFGQAVNNMRAVRGLPGPGRGSLDGIPQTNSSANVFA